MNWHTMTSEERLDAIKHTYEAGDSAGLIASKLGTTRNSIIGYYNRNQDLRESYPLRERGRTPKDVQPRQSRRQNPKPRTKRPADAPILDQKAPPARKGVPLLSLGRFQCRWSVNDAKRGEVHLFCGDKGFPYCAHHAKLAVGRGTEGERTAHKFLEKVSNMSL